MVRTYTPNSPHYPHSLSCTLPPLPSSTLSSGLSYTASYPASTFILSQTIATDLSLSTLSHSHTHTHTLSLSYTHALYDTLTRNEMHSTSNLFNTPSLCALSPYVPPFIMCYTTQAEKVSRRDEGSWTDARRRLKGGCDSY